MFSKLAARRAHGAELKRVAGIVGPVEAIFDRWGVPHLFAESEEDLFFAQGFVHAADRLFQLDTSRRAAKGTLSELFGRRTLEIDRFMRRLGLHRVAAQELVALDGRTRRWMEAYANGVNAGAAQSRRPLELRLLRARFAPWEVLDTLAFGRLMAFSLVANWEAELARADLVSRLGAKTAAAVEPRFSELHPAILGLLHTAMPSLDRLQAEFATVASALGIGGAASNAWAVTPSRTAGGRALLANDPHLTVRIPSTWYEIELQAPGLHAVGASIPGIPGILIGHNERIAWGITASGVDVQDIVVIPADEMSAAPTVREEIHVRGRKPVFEEVVLTEHGPALDREASGRGLVLKSTVLDPRPIGRPLFDLMEAGDWAAFRDAASRSIAPSLCYAYADVDGNIGFQLFGLVPRRRNGNGYLPWPSGDERFGWDGFLSFEEVPSELNPASGVVVNANNQIESGPELQAPGEFVDGYRALRIREMLGERTGLGVAEFQELQGDVYAPHAAELLAAIDSWHPSDTAIADVLVALRRWDRRLAVQSREAAIFEAFMIRLLWNVLGSRIGDHANQFLGKPERGLSNAPPLIWRVVSLVINALRERDGWFATKSGWEQTLDRSMREALADLRRRLGKDQTVWAWGKMHRMTFRHPLGGLPVVGRFLNRGPIAMPGDMHTLLQAAYLTYAPYDVEAWTVSYRQVLDVGNWDNCWAVHAPGQSGRPGSPHYADLIGPWRRVAYHPMLFGREAALRAAERTLTLEPQ